MKIVRDIATLKQAIRGLREIGKRIALVPTMGALHDGHISLVKEGLTHADAVVATIFVNPTQFGPGEDFAKYPRTEEADIEALKAAGAEVAYLPLAAEMYPDGAVTRVQVGPLANELCGAFRPGHFDGVATIVTKLFMQVQPDAAIFGEKDYQQLTIIRRFTADLNIPVEIIGAPVVREADGLAMSSRNRYLSPQERAIAPAMYKLLQHTSRSFVIPAKAGMSGLGDPGLRRDDVLKKAEADLLSAGFTRVDYVSLRNAATLETIDSLEKPARLLAAAHIGKTRLIDNVEVLP